MGLILKVAAMLLLAGSLIDGAFDSRGFDPWDYSADLPGGYFTLLRIAVTAAGAVAAWQLYQVFRRPTSLAIIYGGIAVLFQPFVRVEFDYETWQWIDLAVFVFMVTEVYASFRIGRAILRSGILAEGALASTTKHEAAMDAARARRTQKELERKQALSEWWTSDENQSPARLLALSDQSAFSRQRSMAKKRALDKLQAAREVRAEKERQARVTADEALPASTAEVCAESTALQPPANKSHASDV